MSPPPSYRLRAAGSQDVPLLARHRVEMFADMGRLAADGAADALRAATEPVLAEWLAAGTLLAWLAEPASRPALVVGGAALQLRPMLPRPGPDGKALLAGPEAYVLNVFVERAWRRRGVASFLMQHLLGYARERRLRVVTLHASEEGRKLYEKLGFAATNEMRLQ